MILPGSYRDERPDALACDACPDAFFHLPLHFAWGYRLRREAARVGWRRVEGRDLCPRCRS